MDPPPREDVVCLHLAEYADRREAETVPAAVSPAGIATAVGLDDERIGDRFSLLSTIDGLEAEGLLEGAVRTVAADIAAERGAALYVRRAQTLRKRL